MNIAEKIDHTILRADAREDEVKRYCREAVQYHLHRYASIHATFRWWLKC